VSSAGAAGWAFAAAGAVYGCGPRTPRPLWNAPFPPVPSDPSEVVRLLALREAAAAVRPDNGARVVWGGAEGERTPWSLVYLHGFGACWREGAPVHLETARRYGANLLLTRLAGHGLISEEPLAELRADDLWADALEALAWGLALGERVLLMGTSTGAALALRLAAERPSEVSGLALYSPNLRLRNPYARVLTLPWGVPLVKAFTRSRFRESDPNSLTDPYWYRRYRLEGAAQLQALVQGLGGETLRKVRAPYFAGVYRRDRRHQDSVVDVEAARRGLAAAATRPQDRRFVEFPEAGCHVLPCDLTHPGWRDVRDRSWAFLEEVLGWEAR